MIALKQCNLVVVVVVAQWLRLCMQIRWLQYAFKSQHPQATLIESLTKNLQLALSCIE